MYKQIWLVQENRAIITILLLYTFVQYQITNKDYQFNKQLFMEEQTMTWPIELNTRMHFI